MDLKWSRLIHKLRYAGKYQHKLCDKKNEKERIETVHSKQPNTLVDWKCIIKPALCPEVYEGEKEKCKKSGSQECYIALLL